MEAKTVFAERFSLLRKRAGVSLQKIADELDVDITPQSLSLYEKGQRTINIDLLQKIAEYFNVSADYLIGLSENATTDTNLQAVCDYTGLSEEAIEALESHRDRIIKRTTDKCENSTSIFNIGNNDTVSDVLTSNEFWNIIYYLCLLEQSTKEYSTNTLNAMLNTTPNEWEKEIHLMVDSSTFANVYRYSITQEIEKISDMFDKRVQVNKEASENGKHNPKKE